MKSKIWICGWFAIVVLTLVFMGGFVYKIDPYFHFHKPDTENYYYKLDNQRSQNDGISKNFDYDALITGTSMTENFLSSELDELFGVNSVKVCYSGGTYKELNDNLKTALKNHKDLKMVVRGLDIGYFFDKSDRMRQDLGNYPTYLYDDDPLNDIDYIFNKDIIFKRIYPMLKEKMGDDFTPGITSFDEYSRWQQNVVFGNKETLPEGFEYLGQAPALQMSDEEKSEIYKLITEHVTSLADEYPDTQFYYFFTPYSIAWYKDMLATGDIGRQMEAEEYIIELILEHKNIKLFSFSGEEDIVADLNNYKDILHYGTWVNSYILSCMKMDVNLLTKDNYKDYLKKQYDLYFNYDYNSLKEQIDYSDDDYAGRLFEEKIQSVLRSDS